MHIIKMIFKYTPNSKEVAASVTGVPLALPRALQHHYQVSAPHISPYHNRASSYNMSPQNQCRSWTNRSPGPGEPPGRAGTNANTKSLKIQDQVSAYWLAQRVKFPKDEAGRAKYVTQLETMHQITVHAMKCKQTTDPAHVTALRNSMMAFADTYFSADDLKHIHEHHGDEHK